MTYNVFGETLNSTLLLCFTWYNCYYGTYASVISAVNDDVFVVSSWDGGQSLLDKEHAADKAHELKRCMSEMYDEDLDRGRVSGRVSYNKRL